MINDDGHDDRGTLLTNIRDTKVRQILSLLPDVCQCFRESPRWDGHIVNPPCPSVKLATQMVGELED